ncbi:DUF3761 domain-containing protein [Pseudonocardia dioxanivorans]|uniref:DUF3761 domain-containing protein n=1 Tax=Pseudonocardia dioxanivorans TaxID=240495 RepID=UPI001F3741CA|nr:DUF3761 domain-containing protein [Pseudonocardia dioxanivorans]
MRRRPRSVLAASVLVVLGALFAVIPATAPLGLVLCLAASVPAVMAWRGTRGAPPNVRRPAVAAVALAPTFLVVAIVVGTTTSSPARPAALLAEPGGTTRAAVPSLAPPPPSPTSLRQAPVSTSAASPTVAPAPVTSRRAAAVAPRPTAAPPSVAGRAAPACDTSTHYVNVSGNCVPRPGSSTTESPTAVCKDGEPSYSQHRRGTCSGHGGVDRYLVNLPA